MHKANSRDPSGSPCRTPCEEFSHSLTAPLLERQNNLAAWLYDKLQKENNGDSAGMSYSACSTLDLDMQLNAFLKSIVKAATSARWSSNVAWMSWTIRSQPFLARTPNCIGSSVFERSF